jgi:protein AroM
MSVRTLGTLTIGQAPRADVTPIIDAHIPPQTRRIHRGLLDGFTRAEIDARYGADPDEPVLITRLLDGSSVQVSARKANEAVGEKISALEAEGCDVILLLCTGTFHGLSCAKSFLLQPDHLIPPAAAGLTGGHQLGIVVPLASQMRSESGKWGALAQVPIFSAANPYADGLDAEAEAGTDLKDRHAQALLLDCMGFTEKHRRAAADATGLPVILSNALMAKAVGELLA